MEEWRDIDGCLGYQVSSQGRVRSSKRSGYKILACASSKAGYRYFAAYINGERRVLKVSRVVAQAFLDNPDNKPEVDHINRNPTDDTCTNLRWATRSENQVNTSDRIHSTEHRNICVRYQVSIKREPSVLRKSFSTLAAAIAWRDKMSALYITDDGLP